MKSQKQDYLFTLIKIFAGIFKRRGRTSGGDDGHVRFLVVEPRFQLILVCKNYVFKGVEPQATIRKEVTRGVGINR